MRPLRRDVQMIFQDPYSLAEPAAHRRHHRRRPVPAPGRRARGRGEEGGPAPAGAGRASAPSTTTAIRTSSPAASGSASASPARSRSSRSWSSRTSRSPRWTCRSRRRSSTCWTTSRSELGLTYVIIAHDLSVIRHVSDRIAVMYLGKIVELADRESLYERADAPVHQGAAVRGAGARTPSGATRSASGSCSRATCPRRSRRRAAAASTPGAGRRRRSARRRSRRWSRCAPGHQVACHHPENAPDQAPRTPLR